MGVGDTLTVPGLARLLDRGRARRRVLIPLLV